MRAALLRAMRVKSGQGGGEEHCEWAAALERVCPFRQVSKTVGQKTVWQLFNTIEYEVRQRQRSQSRNEVRWGNGGSEEGGCRMKKVAALGK